MWCVTAPSAGHLTLLFIYFFLQVTFLPGSFPRWLGISFHRLLFAHHRPSSWPQTSSARLGSAQPACDGSLSASSRPATWQNSTLQSCVVVVFIYFCPRVTNSLKEGHRKKVGIFISCWIPPEDGRDSLWSGRAAVFTELSAEICSHMKDYSHLSSECHDLDFLILLSFSSHWDDWHFIYFIFLLEHCFLSSSNTRMCELYPLVIMLACYQLMLWLSCEMMWQSLMHFDCVWRERAGGT